MQRFYFVFVICLFFPALRLSADPQASLRSETLTAIDILLEPDDAMFTRAEADNARLKKNSPQGFALDATHVAHISVLQCYVRAQDIEKVFTAVKRVKDPAGMVLKTADYDLVPWKGQELAGISVVPTPELLRYQQAVVASVAPFIVKNGTSEAFVPNGDGSQVGDAIVSYVNTFIPQYVGKNYNPHVTIGLGREDFLKAMTAAPYVPFTFTIKGVGVYQLGDFGTARKKLWSSAQANP